MQVLVLGLPISCATRVFRAGNLSAGQGGALSIALQRQAAAPRRKRHHLLIAGTGRAGTSFLVRFLTELGLETHISRHGENPWDETAQAGLENPPAAGFDDLPYIFKTPWAYEFVEQMLTDSAITLDAVIVPMRDLVEAAASRSIVQLQAIHRGEPWMAQLNTSWANWGYTPGGTVYSLDPLDQSRLLAVGFHRLVNRLVQAEVPLIFIAFPRLAQDADYLVEKLRPIVPRSIGIEEARRAHSRVADAALVRVGRELRDNGRQRLSAEGAARPMPSLQELDNIALRRELVALRHETARLRDRLAASEAERAPPPLIRRIARRCRRTFRAVLQAKQPPDRRP